MYTFIKFGGSVITDKRGQEAPDLPLINQLASELAQARQARPDLAIILGHGSGSFGHHYAARYGIHRGLAPGSDYHGFAQTAAAALRLNRIVVEALLAAGLPALALQPSASIQAHAGQIVSWATANLAQALEHQLIPVVHGDVAFDSAQGSCIISTEVLLAHLAHHTPLRPQRIILVGEAGIFSADPRHDPQAQRIPLITAANLASALHATSGSHAVDVTGGMRSKLELMWQLVQAIPALEVHLIGPAHGNLCAALLGEAQELGTVIRAV